MEEGGKGYGRVDVYHRWYTEVPLVGHGSPISGTWKSHLWDTPMECSLTLLEHSHQTWGIVHPRLLRGDAFSVFNRTDTEFIGGGNLCLWPKRC